MSLGNTVGKSRKGKIVNFKYDNIIEVHINHFAIFSVDDIIAIYDKRSFRIEYKICTLICYIYIPIFESL